ncbi:restriction endonuclease subunit S [Sphaerotilus uruguayifluvii]|uniref:Type I restriction enzyme S subunit n=1 Tax=Sphaerotilus uruguayifluvii TaxID=2735897 RepID=A0ABX2FXI9_9BURK|nr:type I restriction enzyme S subunit [Leptothrix sp. C29]
MQEIVPVMLPPNLPEPPQGWRWAKLTDLARLESGHTPSRSRPDWWGGDISWVSLTEIRALDGTWVKSTQIKTNEAGIANSSARILPRGTVCFSRTASVGFVTIMARPMATSQDFANWVCGDELDPEFLMYALICSRRELRALATGATHKTIYMPMLESFHLCLPDRPTQVAIVQALKAQLAAAEAARQAAQAQVDHADLLETALRQEAFLAVLDVWPRESAFVEVCDLSAGGTPSRGKADYFRGDIPWVKTLDLNFGTVTHTEESISAEAMRSMRGNLLPAGTVMVAMYGGAGTIGKSGVLGISACTNQAICALQPHPHLLTPDFLHEWVRFIRPEWMKYSGGNRKDPNINKGVVEAMTLPLPPVSEQMAFCQTLSGKLAQARLIKEHARSQLAELKQLPARLLAQAFDLAP